MIHTTHALLTELDHLYEMLTELLLNDIGTTFAASPQPGSTRANHTTRYNEYDDDGPACDGDDDYLECMHRLVQSIAERADAVIATSIVSRNAIIAGVHWLQRAERHTGTIMKLANNVVTTTITNSNNRRKASKNAGADKKGSSRVTVTGGSGSLGENMTYEKSNNNGFEPVGLFATNIRSTSKFLDLLQHGFQYDDVVMKKAMRRVLNGAVQVGYAPVDGAHESSGAGSPTRGA